ncbi:MAG: hypothetical protein WHV67_04570 [Thermoanaerobaculia bacterium]
MEYFKREKDKLILEEDFFRNLKEPYEGEDFYFSLGFFSIKLKLRKKVLDILSMKFKDKKGDFCVEPKIFKSPLRDFKYKKGNPEIYTIDFIEKGEKLIFFAYNFAALIDLKNLEDATLAVGDIDDETLSGEIENFLRIYSGLILPKYKAFLFHSSAVLTEMGAFVFFGPSSAGKSTIANIFKDEGFKVLSDDLNIFLLKDKLEVMASPFLSEVDKAEEGIFPVQRIFYLRKDEKNFIEKASSLSQQAYLFSSLPVLNTLKFFHKEIFSVISDIIKLKEVEVLHFKKDKEIVKWLK